jgi:hypothetical protein
MAAASQIDEIVAAMRSLCILFSFACQCPEKRYSSVPV